MIDASNFRTEDIHPRQVVLADGKEHTLYFKEVPAGLFELVMASMRSKDAKQREDGVPRLIAAALCTADGAPVLTQEQAAQLKPGVSMAIANAALEVNPASYAAPAGNG